MPKYSQLLIYYFSGTGNSANVARWLAQAATENGMRVEMVNIAHSVRLYIQTPEKNNLIAFCSPVHGFNYPPVMQSFIRHFPKGNNPVLLLNTRAGMLIGKWITPGLSGVTFYLSALVLRLKGYHIKAMLPVDLPSNWLSLHPGLNDRTVQFLHERNKLRVSEFANNVFKGGTDFRSLRSIIPDVLVSPVSVLYYIAGRFFLAKTFYASSACNNCGVCISQCPVKAIKSVENRPFWTLKCESCMHCMSFCPHRAIETAHGSIVVFVLIFSLVIWSSFELLFDKVFFMENELVKFAVQTGLMVVLITIWYRMLHFMLRYKCFNKLITYTSLTFYRFWGKRYRAPKD